MLSVGGQIKMNFFHYSVCKKCKLALSKVSQTHSP
jgi:hypothetical protein